MNPIKTTPKDFFLHLGATIALYIGVGALINLSFSIINYYFPDSLAGYFYGNSVAWPISMLIVLIPILYIAEWLIARDFKINIEKKNLWIRRWRIYLTLFLTAALFAGDLIALINTYLNGEISTRFILKVVLILIVAGALFKYYFFSLNDTKKWARIAKKVIPWFGIILVVIAIVIGFITVGSPTKQRNLRFDNQRVNDLSTIQWQIVSYWQQKGKLPASLASTTDSISGMITPTDPETKNAYEYTLKSDLSFELCADFALKYEDMSGKGSYGGVMPYAVDMSYPSYAPEGTWKHDAGRTCFTRTIDPEKYPKIKQ